MSPAAQPIPTLPQPVTVGEIKGTKPKIKSTQPTFLGGDATANAPTSPGASSGKTFLGS